jgi:hypothetical protein
MVRLDALMIVQILQFGALQLERCDWSATPAALDTLAPCQGSAETLSGRLREVAAAERTTTRTTIEAIS